MVSAKVIKVSDMVYYASAHALIDGTNINIDAPYRETEQRALRDLPNVRVAALAAARQLGAPIDK
jgi:hypothetical protein